MLHFSVNALYGRVFRCGRELRRCFLSRPCAAHVCFSSGYYDKYGNYTTY